MKVFGIGLPRTGTLSLAIALDMLGFKPGLHNPWSIFEIARAGSATDATVACRFRELAALWPDAKFIYTTRDMESWLASSERHYESTFKPMIEAGWNEPATRHVAGFAESYLRLFGTLEFSREVWRESYCDHEANVGEFFHDQPDRLLTIDITEVGWSEKEKWCKIMKFTDVESMPFPWEHKMSS